MYNRNGTICLKKYVKFKKKTEFEKRFSAIRSIHPIQYIRCCELIKYTCVQLIFKLDFYESKALDKKI